MTVQTVQIGDATLINGDCLEILPTLGPVDAVVTDPPYGVNFRGEEWDSAIPNWLPTARAASPLIIFTTGPTTFWQYPPADWVGCWQRPGSTARTSWGGFSGWSPILVYGKGQGHLDSCWLPAIQHQYGAEGVGHPSPKPVELMRWIVMNMAADCQTICDPFMGSGTTGVACAKLGRKFIGIEIEPRYFEIACRRIEEAYKQPDMFIDRPAPAKQEQLGLLQNETAR